MDDLGLLKRWLERWFRQSRVLDNVKTLYRIQAEEPLTHQEKQHEIKAYRRIMQILDEEGK